MSQEVHPPGTSPPPGRGRAATHRGRTRLTRAHSSAAADYVVLRIRASIVPLREGASVLSRPKCAVKVVKVYVYQNKLARVRGFADTKQALATLLSRPSILCAPSRTGIPRFSTQSSKMNCSISEPHRVAVASFRRNVGRGILQYCSGVTLCRGSHADVTAFSERTNFERVILRRRRACPVPSHRPCYSFPSCS